MTGDILDGCICPECGGRIINDGFDDWSTLELNCHCEACGWEGTESECLDEDDDEDYGESEYLEGYLDVRTNEIKIPC